MKLISSISIAVFFICLWQAIIIVCELPNYILPSPLAVYSAFISNWQIIMTHAIPTIQETLLGLLLGVATGFIAACLIANSKLLAKLFLPAVLISQVMPVFAIAPLLVIWFGYGMQSKIIVAMLMIFFPVTSSLYDGLRQTPANWLELAESMQAGKWRTFWHIRLPAALPSLASGIRLAAVAAPIGAIVGEWVGASKGLGYLMLNANARMQIDIMFAALCMIIIISLLLYSIVNHGLKKMVWWQGANHA
jgi:putative hydroxymethylpyrimidine transport system permease protein